MAKSVFGDAWKSIQDAWQGAKDTASGLGDVNFAPGKYAKVTAARPDNANKAQIEHDNPPPPNDMVNAGIEAIKKPKQPPPDLEKELN